MFQSSLFHSSDPRGRIMGRITGHERRGGQLRDGFQISINEFRLILEEG